MMQEYRESLVYALLVGEGRESRRLFQEVFRAAGWRLYSARDPKYALQSLRQRTMHVVVVSDTCRWDWKRALEELRTLPYAPQLVVMSRQADEALWAEVINWGGYDVLAEPLQREEVERVMSSARRHFEPQSERGPALRVAVAS